MARKQERVTIGGVPYLITQLGAVEGRGLYKKFMTAISPLLREVISGPLFADVIKQAEAKTGDDEAALLRMVLLMAPVLTRAFEVISDELFEEMCARFAPECKVGSGKASNGSVMMLDLGPLFDQHFAGDYTWMTAWLCQCVRVNGFLGKLGSLSAAQAAPAEATQ